MRIVNDKINIGLVLCIGILIYSGFASHTLLSRYEEFSHWVLHTNRVLEKVKDIRSLSEKVSSDAKTELIKGGSSRAIPFNDEEKIRVAVGDLRLLTTDNPDETTNTAQLVLALDHFFSGVKKITELRVLDGNEHTEAVLSVLDKIEDVENKLLSERLIGAQKQADAARKVLFGRTVLAVALVSGLAVLLNQQLLQRKTAEESVFGLNAQLSAQLRELNAVNKELEAFSYSVSHDLRAPLRSIMGFSEMVKEDYSSNLEREGIDYLNRIIGASRRMGELIDSLLKMSRLGRREVLHENVDLVSMSQSILGELQGRELNREMSLRLPLQLPIIGDPVLLRVVLENLLSNAWKFTRTRAVAEISVGLTKTEKGMAYFIQDNGVGFDMTYADKLFGAFQRLHSQSDFEGIGIGLATVQRIIHRHGGHIWVQSQLNVGTTFYFTV